MTTSISDTIFNTILRVCVRGVVDTIFEYLYYLIFETTQDEDAGEEKLKTDQLNTSEHTQTAPVVKKNNCETVQDYSQPVRVPVVPTRTLVTVKRNVTTYEVRNRVLVPVIEETVTTTWS